MFIFVSNVYLILFVLQKIPLHHAQYSLNKKCCIKSLSEFAKCPNTYYSFSCFMIMMKACCPGAMFPRVGRVIIIHPLYAANASGLDNGSDTFPHETMTTDGGNMTRGHCEAQAQ